jgi:hypothetical protein
VPEADFNTVSEGRRILNSSRLYEYGGEWQEKCSSLEEAKRLEAIAQLKEPINECCRFFRLFLLVSRPHYPDGFDNFLNPLASIFEILRHWARALLGFPQEPDPLPPTLSSEATENLVRHGWCRYAIENMLFPHNSPSIFSYAAFFARCPSTLGEDHCKCGPRECTVINIDIASYEARHNIEYCNIKGGKPCVTLFLEMESVRALL